MRYSLLPLSLALAMHGSADRALPAASEPRVLIPIAGAGSATWRYTTDDPGDGWKQPEFDDSRWPEGKAGFGVADRVTPPDTIGTPWTTSSIWLRKTIHVGGPLEFTRAGLIVRHDEDVEVYLGGILVFSAQGFNTEWTAYDVTRKLKGVLKPGRNVLAVRVSQSGGGQYIDVGLVLDPERKLVVPIEPVDPDELKELSDARWSEDQAWAWYAGVGPIAGVNYLPRTAVNMTEMWQEATFDPKTIEEELGWAETAGYNSLRVFVQYLVWKQDPQGLIERLDSFLSMADEHSIRVMLVPFCDCAFAGREPYLGKQDHPVPGVHNSGWVPSPGLRRAVDRAEWPHLERYIKDLVGRFGKDRRVLIWDLYNEPGNSGMGEKSLPLVMNAFRWAREAKATQPLTVGAWTRFESRMSRALMEMSDVVSFHGYDHPEGIVKKIRTCRRYRRPVICTEWLNRGANNRFETILPIFARERIGGYHWGLVAGRTQTYMPWGSKKGDPMPAIWQHDVFHADGTPYHSEEFERLREFSRKFRSRRTTGPDGASGGNPLPNRSFERGQEAPLGWEFRAWNDTRKNARWNVDPSGRARPARQASRRAVLRGLPASPSATRQAAGCSVARAVDETRRRVESCVGRAPECRNARQFHPCGVSKSSRTTPLE